MKQQFTPLLAPWATVCCIPGHLMWPVPDRYTRAEDTCCLKGTLMPSSLLCGWADTMRDGKEPPLASSCTESDQARLWEICGHHSLPVTQASLQLVPYNQLQDAFPTGKHPESFCILFSVPLFMVSYMSTFWLLPRASRQPVLAKFQTPSYWFFIRTVWHGIFFTTLQSMQRGPKVMQSESCSLCSDIREQALHHLLHCLLILICEKETITLS